MLTREQARRLVVDELGAMRTGGGPELVIDDDATEEHDFGWLFFANSPEFVETRDVTRMMVGGGPFFVEREGGRVISTGSCRSVERMLEAYRACGDPMAHRSGRLLAHLPEGSRLDRREALEVVRRFSGASLAEARSWFEEVSAADAAVPFPLSERQDADQAARALASLGLVVSPEWIRSGEDETVR